MSAPLSKLELALMVAAPRGIERHFESRLAVWVIESAYKGEPHPTEWLLSRVGRSWCAMVGLEPTYVAELFDRYAASQKRKADYYEIRREAAKLRRERFAA